MLFRSWVSKQEKRIQFFKHGMGESVNIKPDILPKSGGGQDGTDTLRKSYQKDTPGQTKIIGFKQFNKNK